MWLYEKESEHIETITHLETGAQVRRSANQIWWRVSPLDQGENIIAHRENIDGASKLFADIVVELRNKRELIGV